MYRFYIHLQNTGGITRSCLRQRVTASIHQIAGEEDTGVHPEKQAVPASYTGQGNQQDFILAGFTAGPTSSLEPAETHRPSTQERGTAAPQPADGALSWRPSRPAPLQPWRRPNLATASLGQGAGGDAGTWPAAGGTLRGTPPAAPSGPTGTGATTPSPLSRRTPNFHPQPPPTALTAGGRRGRRTAPCAPWGAGGRAAALAPVGAERARPGSAGAKGPREEPSTRRRNEGPSQTGRSGSGRALGGGGARPRRRPRPEARPQAAGEATRTGPGLGTGCHLFPSSSS